ncbi:MULTISPECIES: LacI family DNA-binding transcriptional regulator [Brachybacterium]|uniref:Transcriptional regulator LacI/GalR-like sensor domain-containing protein n=1 Tax=Brachybacterium alimentarium TaxID=47845 RepID=A0A2A3YKC3_9MICO|nr:MULTISPECIES: substrate-binding domain-containing protein [Brachybacterium]PCC39806.1 hypothetical protein CIK66_07500 [Brachybacterium alimentarium]RCS62504.1 LacI family transcriptional regulator [Brachybacterium sp. JB7]RCS64862.1 LacI family transcriptional regulator [Brachybacterium alimentarium]RCS79033.1 LacI family transcriptional regulator [Brachybacterium alimentarium]RCS83639.1 LacI family transcriptional regulator [Brachybacterium alimentarium]
MAAGTIGMPVPRSMWSASSEQFHTLVLRGVEETAVAEGYSVLSAVVDTLEAEIALIRRWAHQRLVDVVILKDLRRDDPRPRLLRELRMPFVLVGDVRQTGAEAAVLTDNSRSMHVLLEELLALGHHRIAHVGGPGELLHSQWRLGAYVDFMADHALAPSYLEGDYGTASGERCVRALLALEEVPTVIVFDNDAMAIGGADALHRLGVDVPGDISVVSWDDSLSCQTYDPPLAVLGHRAPQLGTELGTAAIALLAGDPEAMRRVAEIPRIVPRGSLAATG